MKGFKKCPNGHYYKEDLEQCPYCPIDKKLEEIGKNPPVSFLPRDTAMCYVMPDPEWLAKQEKEEKLLQKYKPRLEGEINGKKIDFSIKKLRTSIYLDNDGVPHIERPNNSCNEEAAINFRGTPFFEIIDYSIELEYRKWQEVKDGDVIKIKDTAFTFRCENNCENSIETTNKFRGTRKLVGWLVTFSLDNLGTGYELFEGRNSIGRDEGCNITVNDRMISGKHATILFRNDQFRVKDEMSAHGTFVNNKEIGFEPYELQDGDIIKMGNIVFKFKSAL